MEWTEFKKEDLVLALMLASENKDLARIFRERGYITLEEEGKAAGRFTIINKAIENGEVSKEEAFDKFVQGFNFTDLFKVPEVLKEILEIFEEGLKDLEEKRQKIINFLQDEDDKLSDADLGITSIEDLVNIKKQIAFRKKIFKFLEKKLETGNDKEYQRTKVNLKEILDLDLVKIIEDDIKQEIDKKRGFIRMKCPLKDCTDTDQSFVIDKEKNKFYCFKCLRGGGVVHYFVYANRDTINGALEKLQFQYLDDERVEDKKKFLRKQISKKTMKTVK